MAKGGDTGGNGVSGGVSGGNRGDVSCGGGAVSGGSVTAVGPPESGSDSGSMAAGGGMVSRGDAGAFGGCGRCCGTCPEAVQGPKVSAGTFTEAAAHADVAVNAGAGRGVPHGDAKV